MNDGNRTILRRILCSTAASCIAGRGYSPLFHLEPMDEDKVFYIKVEPEGPTHWWTILRISRKTIKTDRTCLTLRKAYYKTLEEYGL